MTPSEKLNLDVISVVRDIFNSSVNEKVAIQKVLEYITKQYEFDCFCIFEESEKYDKYENSFRWCGENNFSQKDCLYSVPVQIVKEFFKNNRDVFIYLNNVKPLNEDSEFIKFTINKEIKSSIKIPIYKNEKCVRFISFDSYNKTSWKNDEIATLKYLAKIISIIHQSIIAQLKIEEESVLIDCIEVLHSELKPKEAIYKLLETIAKYYKAERSYIFEISKDGKFISNTVEWVDDDIVPFIESLQEMPIKSFELWLEKCEKEGEFKVEISDLSKETYEYDLMQEQKINSIISAPIKDVDGTITGFIGVDNPKVNKEQTVTIRSVTKFITNFLKETRHLELLNKLSYYDTLTNVKNRNAYRKELNEFDSTEIESLVMVYVDIKALERINFTYGLEVGDRYLKTVAKELSKEFEDCVYRMDGDEFLVIKINMSEDVLEEKLVKFKSAISKEDIQISLGYTYNTNSSLDENLKDITNSEKYSKILAFNLDKEIQSGKFIVYLQPQLDLVKNEVLSAEALVRRLNSKGEIQAPYLFLPFYEKEGLISKIDTFILKAVCMQLKKWKEQGLKKEIQVSVNCSRTTLTEENIVEKFANICDEFEIKRSQIIVEITETINAIDNKKLAKILNSFSDAGFDLSLDDFGCGYSNLTSLKMPYFHELKLDMELINDIETNEKTKTLTKVTLNLCKEFGNLISVAEGVENKEQFDILKELGCNKIQGYFLDKPMKIEEFTKKYMK